MLNSFIGIILIAIGIIVITYIPGTTGYKEKNYSGHPVSKGMVNRMQDFGGDRWIVEFEDEDGNKVLGMDNIISYNTFSPKKYHLPKPGNEEKIYYWKYDGNSKYSVNDRNIEYYFHFCNEDLYTLQKTKGRRNFISAGFFGTLIIICGSLLMF